MTRLPRKLSTRKRKFVDSYAVHLNATKAALDAGYSENTAYSQGSRLLKNVEVQAMVAAKVQETGLTRERTLRELAYLAYSRPADLFDENGNLKRITELPEHVQASIASIEVVRGNLDRGDGAFDEIHKVKQWDKTKALEMAGKYLKLFDQPAETNVQIVVSWADGSSMGSDPNVIDVKAETTTGSKLLTNNGATDAKSNGINKD